MLVVNQARQYLVDFEIATNPKYEPNWHHERIAEELEHIAQHGDRDYKILILSVPPRHGKSRQATIDFPAWLLGNRPEVEVITASYSADLAVDFGTQTRELIQGDAYQAIFDTRLKQDQKAKGRWKVSSPDANGRMKATGGGYTSLGVGGAATGRGANIFIIDDPIKNREEADSEVYRDRVWNWFASTAWTRLHPNGVMIVIMTRWHMDDLVGRIFAKTEELGSQIKIKLLKFKAIADKDSKRRKEGEALWPERYSLENLQATKSLIGPYEFQSLYQGTPILAGDREFKDEWIKNIDEEALSLMNTRNFLTVDTAMSKKAQADFCGFCDNRVNKENFWHLMAWRMKIGPEALVDTLFTLHAKNRYEKIGIEKTAYLDGLKPYMDAEQRKRNVFLPIVELQHRQTAKEIRIRSLIPRYASGSVFHVRGRCDALEEEMMQFPSGVHDDVIDATAYQSQIVKEGSRGIKAQGPQWKGYNRR